MHFAWGSQTLLIIVRNGHKVIHSNLQEPYRLGGSNRVSADRPLWMNLWKLWISPSLLFSPPARPVWTERPHHGGLVARGECVARLVG